VELFFVALGGAVIGLAARYSLPRRTTQGWALVPALGTAVASAVWVALTWLGLQWDGGWIWWISLGLAAVASVAAHIMLSNRRMRSDQVMMMSLMKTGAPKRTKSA
jgi:ABC-type branched-subunit amino acid transport system permease subunit